MGIENNGLMSQMEIPSTWNMLTIKQCILRMPSYGINAPAIPHNSAYPTYIRITDISEDGKYDDSDRKSVITDQKEKYQLGEGDIVLARTGASVGKSYLYDSKDGELVYAGFLIKISVDTQKHNPRYIVGQLRTKRYWEWVSAISMRSGQPGINGKEYASFVIPVAPKNEQDEIASTLSCFDTYIDDLTELIEKKKGIRDGALEDLMSGRTRLEGFDSEWEYVEIKKAYKRLKGTPITAGQMHLLDTKTGDVRIFAGGATEVRAKESDLKDANIIDVPVVIVQSRGIIDFIYCEERCTFKNEMWGYTATDVYAVKFLYYYLKHNVEYFRNAGDGRSSFSQISLPVTEKYEIPLISPKEQRAIVSVLTAMDEEIEALEAERDKMIQIREGAMDDLLTGRVRLTV